MNPIDNTKEFENYVSDMDASYSDSKQVYTESFSPIEPGVYVFKLKKAEIHKSKKTGSFSIKSLWINLSTGTQKGKAQLAFQSLPKDPEDDEASVWLRRWFASLGFEAPDSLGDLAEVLEGLTSEGITIQGEIAQKPNSEYMNLRILSVVMPDEDNDYKEHAGAEDEPKPVSGPIRTYDPAEEEEEDPEEEDPEIPEEKVPEEEEEPEAEEEEEEEDPEESEKLIELLQEYGLDDENLSSCGTVKEVKQFLTDENFEFDTEIVEDVKDQEYFTSLGIKVKGYAPKVEKKKVAKKAVKKKVDKDSNKLQLKKLANLYGVDEDFKSNFKINQMVDAMNEFEWKEKNKEVTPADKKFLKEMGIKFV